jgi:hypothetical protein
VADAVVLYLATPSGPAAVEAMRRGVIGCMTGPAQGNEIPPGAAWAADNGRFGKGWPGEGAWYRWLGERSVGRERGCLFAVAPDTPLDAAATLALARSWLDRIRELDIPAAFAAQDGSEAPGLLPPWDDFDVLFLGGGTSWKTGPSAQRLAAVAKDRGKRVHMGRVNSRRRLAIAAWYGCDSADGTYLAFGPDKNLPKLLAWIDELGRQPTVMDGA